MKRLFLIVLLFSIPGLAADNDITGVDIDARGWTVEVTHETMDTTTGTYDFGGNDVDPSSPTAWIALKRLGYDTTMTGAVVDSVFRAVVRDTILLDTNLRKNYPDNAVDSQQYNGGNVINTYAMSEWVFVSDTIETVTIGANVYTDDEAGNNAYSGSGTNSSTRTYSESKVIANWTWPGNSCVPGDFTVRVFGGHRSATGGKPLFCVKIEVEDESANTWDTLLFSPVANQTFTITGDSLAIVEYEAVVPVAGFTIGDSLRVDFTAYPFWGDSLSTKDDVNATGALYGHQRYYYDTLIYAAVVDSINGDNGTASTILNANIDFETPPTGYESIADAENAIRTSLGEADLKGRAIVYLRTGGYNWHGGTLTGGTSSSYNIVVRNFPGETARIIGQSGSTSFASDSYIKLFGLALNNTGNTFYLEKSFWADSCIGNNGTAAWLYFNPQNYTTNCILNGRWNTPSGNSNDDPACIIRNCLFNFSASTHSTNVYTVIGCRDTIDDVNTNMRFYLSPTAAAPKPEGSIFAFNWMTKGATTFFSVENSIEHGHLIVQNVLEKTAGTGPMMEFGAGGIETPINNVIWWNNTMIGERCNHAYNDVTLNDSLVIRYREFWQWRNNYNSRMAIVTDKDAHTGPAGSPRNGNWAEIFGCGVRDHISFNEAAYPVEWNGVKSWRPNYTWDTEIDTAMDFVGDSSWHGSGGANGNYRYQAGAPAIAFSSDQVIPFDLDGNARDVPTGAVGAYGYEEGTCAAPTISNITFSCTLTVAASEQMTVTGADSTIAIDALPAGLSINTSGLISGTPTVKAAQDSFRIVAYACEGDSTDTAKAYITVDEDSSTTISAHPLDTTLPIGATTEFYVTATSILDLSYQWQRWRAGWTNESGETNDTLSFVTTYAMDGDSFRCIITSAFQTDTSTAAYLDVTPDTVSITVQPVGYTGVAGSVTFFVTATGDPTPTYQWQSDSGAGAASMVDIAGETDDTLSLTADTSMDGWLYKCLATNDGGTDTSDTVTLDIYPQYTLTVTAGANGTTDPSGASTVDSAASTAVSATGNTGFVFNYWETTSGTVTWGDSTSSSTNVTIIGNSEVTAQFKVDTLTLTVTVVGIGTVDTLPAGKDGLFAYGELCTLVATYDTDTTLQWSGQYTSINGDTAFVTMDADKSVTATFYVPSGNINRRRLWDWRFFRSFRGW